MSTKMSKDAIIMDRNNNVAACLRDLKNGEEVSIERGDMFLSIRIIEPVPLGDKVELVPIKKGGLVIKYHENISVAKSDKCRRAEYLVNYRNNGR
jgi:hypothetical protein